MLKLKLVKESAGDSITFGKYKGVPLTWTMIGKIGGNDLYLCDKGLPTTKFGSSNDYMTSKVRTILLDLYKNRRAFSKEERERMVNHPTLNDPIFLLDLAEYVKNKNYITDINRLWWLRSPTKDNPYFNKTPSTKEDVDFINRTAINHDSPYTDFLVPRPAILLKN